MQCAGLTACGEKHEQAVVMLSGGGGLTRPLQAQLDLVQGDHHILQPVVTHTCTHVHRFDGISISQQASDARKAHQPPLYRRDVSRPL